MPLRAIATDGTYVHACDLSDEQWHHLHTPTETGLGLSLPCCGTTAVPKTSPLGVRFFAHQPDVSCYSKPETAPHILLKKLLLTAARGAAWQAQTDATGTTIDGERWTADLLATQGSHKVAVEIQWSEQTNTEIMRRQHRYQNAGIRGVWLMRQPGFPISQDLPAVFIIGEPEAKLGVAIPHTVLSSPSAFLLHNEAFQIITIADFCSALFERRFRYGLEQETQLQFDIETGTMLCWKCSATTRVVTFLTATAGPHNIRHTLELADSLPMISDLLNNALRHRRDIAPIKKRFSRARGTQYVSNGCNKCGVIVGRFYEHEAHYVDYEIVGRITLPLDTHNRPIAAPFEQHWAVWQAPEHDIPPVDQSPPRSPRSRSQSLPNNSSRELQTKHPPRDSAHTADAAAARPGNQKQNSPYLTILFLAILVLGFLTAYYWDPLSELLQHYLSLARAQ